MKILVCFKTVPDFDQVVDADWEHFDVQTSISYVKRTFGRFDETALETALRLKDALQAQGREVECSAITLGTLPPPLRKTLYAAGFDHVHVLENDAGASPTGMEFRPKETAAALAQFISGGNWDLILAGRQAGYADSGIVPFYLAEKLRIPVISEAECLSQTGVNSILIDRRGLSGKERIGICLPAVVVMGNSYVSSLRSATLAAQLQAAKRAAEPVAVCVGDADVKKSPRLVREPVRKTCRILPGGRAMNQSVREIARQLKVRGVS